MNITSNTINYARVNDLHLIKQKKKDNFMMGGIIMLKNIGLFHELYYLVDINWLK